MNITAQKSTVLCFSGLDSTGGAGIQADIEAIAAQGAHAAPVVTALTVQDTRRVSHYQTLKPEIIIQQARAILEDMPISAIKIGMIGDVAIAEAIHSILQDYDDIPVIYDPVLAGGGGGELATSNLVEAVQSLIIPLCLLMTPNIDELHALAREADTDDAAAMELLSQGTEYVLVTGSHARTRDIQHHLYGNHRRLNTYCTKRLDREYHGSGCTLASSIAALLGQGHEISQAIHRAQDYTLQSLQHAQRLGMGQLIPDRFYWNKQH
jgi:hydroxymethylpyrimidine/phosphomethylpyrimidine kinase